MRNKIVAVVLATGVAMGGAMACQAEDPPPVQKPNPQSQQQPSEGAQVKLLNVKQVPFKDDMGLETEPLTSVKVTVKNDSSTVVNANPFGFSVTDATGEKHTAYVTGADNEMPAVAVNPGEKATGVVSFKGSFTAKTLNMSGDLISGESARAEVSQ